jgi:acylphosphatase
MRAVQVRVTGEVQGVGFRWSTAQEAGRLGVLGWVRNEPDGSVLLHAEGEPDAVDALVAWCGNGPTHARVSGVDVEEAEPEGAASFDVRA